MAAKKADAGGSTAACQVGAGGAGERAWPAAADADPADARRAAAAAPRSTPERQRLAWWREAEEGARALALIQASIAKAERMRGELRAGVDAVRRGEGSGCRGGERRAPPGSTMSVRRADSWPTTFRICGGGGVARAARSRSPPLLRAAGRRRCPNRWRNAARADARLGMLSAQGAIPRAARGRTQGGDRHKRRAARVRSPNLAPRRCRSRSRARPPPGASPAAGAFAQSAVSPGGPTSPRRAQCAACARCAATGTASRRRRRSPRATPRHRRSRRAARAARAAAAARRAAAAAGFAREVLMEAARAPEVVVEPAGRRRRRHPDLPVVGAGLKASSATRMSTPRSASSGWSSAAESPRGDESRSRRRLSGWRR